jgi:hypothetical protein
MNFSENSVIVQSWVKQIKAGVYTRNDIPAIGNLREVVGSILDREGK